MSNIHNVCFYGSTKIVLGDNALTEESIQKRNQMISFKQIDITPELIMSGEKCFKANETGTLFPFKNISIVPFKYIQKEEDIITCFKDVIKANELYINARIIRFPLLELKRATREGFSLLGRKGGEFVEEEKKLSKKIGCCYAHYYATLLVKALHSKNYFSTKYYEGYFDDNDVVGGLGETFINKITKKRIGIRAETGI